MASPRPNGTKSGGNAPARNRAVGLRAAAPRAANDNLASPGSRPRWLWPLLAALALAIALFTAFS